MSFAGWDLAALADVSGCGYNRPVENFPQWAGPGGNKKPALFCAGSELCTGAADSYSVGAIQDWIIIYYLNVRFDLFYKIRFGLCSHQFVHYLPALYK